jgi:NADH dehydrogenase [ubiquinone] 1 alpha subcomplex assembly factor 1
MPIEFDLTGFRPVDDRIMGGVSQSSAEVLPEGIIVFSGKVSAENGGGFCSIRSSGCITNVEDCCSICAEVYGDGRIYALRLFSEEGLGGCAYEHRWHSSTANWGVVRCPFLDLVPRFRGRDAPDAPPLNLQRITSIGLLIADRQLGSFSLSIRKIWCE